MLVWTRVENWRMKILEITRRTCQVILKPDGGHTVLPDDDHPDNKAPGDHQAPRGPRRPQEIAIGKTMPSEP